MNKPDFDIIMLALPRWDGQYSSTSYSLAKALSTYTRVFYIDNPFTFKDFVKGRKTPQITRRRRALLTGVDIFTTPDPQYPSLTAVTPQLTWPINWLPSGFWYDLFSRRNDSIVLRAINETLEQYGVKKYVFVNSFNPLFGRYFTQQLSPFKLVYHSVDDISKSVYVERHGTKLENDAVSKADLTFVTSMELQRLKSAYSKHVHYLPNAADIALFNTAADQVLPRPEDLNGIPGDKKIICYTGNICHRLDYELLVAIAKKFNDCILLMVGPLANDNYKKAGLDKISNVVFTGRKTLQELPAYLRQASCCIIPFLCNTLTKSIYPLKINEYLAAGKPVVTTNFSDDIVNFADIACVSHDHTTFLESIARVMGDNSPSEQRRRMDYAAGNNWDARAMQFLSIVSSS